MPHCRFIKWTQETSWAQGHKVELQKVLEACTRKIGVAERYKGDIRYLRVWIQYVSTGATSTNGHLGLPP